MTDALVQQTLKSLKKNNFKAFFAESPERGRKIILEDILPGIGPGVVSYGDSLTLRATGVLEDMRENADSNRWDFMDTFEKGVPGQQLLERRRHALLADIFFAGTNALTYQGQLVNLDMIGNRVGGIVCGPRHVILTIGTNKIVDGLDQAMTRVREKAAPLNARRIGAETPCAKTGECTDCESPARICNVWSITEKSRPPGRISVVLIQGDFGL